MIRTHLIKLPLVSTHFWPDSIALEKGLARHRVPQGHYCSSILVATVYHGVSLIELEVGMPSYAFLQSGLCRGDAILGGDDCSHAEAGQDRFCGSTWQLYPCHCEDETGLKVEGLWVVK